jgi:hypothetical protein
MNIWEGLQLHTKQRPLGNKKSTKVPAVTSVKAITYIGSYGKEVMTQ